MALIGPACPGFEILSTDATLTGGYAKWGVVSNGTNWYLL
jgi:hypothetical protein